MDVEHGFGRIQSYETPENTQEITAATHVAWKGKTGRRQLIFTRTVLRNRDAGLRPRHFRLFARKGRVYSTQQVEPTRNWSKDNPIGGTLTALDPKGENRVRLAQEGESE